jgi:fumarate reductase flavoprotein subunit
MKRRISLFIVLAMLLALCPALAESRDETVDFVVVGAGAAGVSAATEAARQGKSVILLEKLSFAGGSSALNEGFLWACGSDFNALTGKGYSKEQMKAYLRESSRGNANHALNDNIVDMSAEIMDFIVEGGAKFYTDKFTPSGADARDLDVFMAEGAGHSLFNALLAIAERYGVIPRYESPAVALIVEEGAVKGVTVQDAQGTYNIYAQHTILATGGFLQSDELMDRFMPEWNSEYPYCTAGATGDGHKWALELGAYMSGYGCGGVWRTEDGKNGYHVEGGLAPVLSFFMVNIEGNRFCNEYMGADKNQLVNMQTGKKAYCFADANSPYVALLEQGVANGYAYKADTLEELCDVYGIPKDSLLASVEAYNKCKAEDGQDPFQVPLAYMTSMTTAPYYMSLYDPAMNTNCLMGLATDAYCRILREDGSAIDGLYGAGEIIMGNLCGGTTEGPRYPACGSCLAAGIYGGPLAVRHALGIIG